MSPKVTVEPKLLDKKLESKKTVFELLKSVCYMVTRNKSTAF